MEDIKDPTGMLDHFHYPGFCVKENQIVYANAAAQALFVEPGTDVRTLLQTGQEEYAAFKSGCLYLKLKLADSDRGASVTKEKGYHLFLLHPDYDHRELQCLALAAREIRDMLNIVNISANQLIATSSDQASAASMNRGIFQLHRLANNMSDAGHIVPISQQKTQDIPALLAEIFEKAQTHLEQAGVTLTYQGISEPIWGLAADQLLERAVLNILSNSLKFVPKDCKIDARLSRKKQMLRLSITDNGNGFPENVLSNVFHRYQREPGFEIKPMGVGLGLLIVRNAAISHGGTVLIDRPRGKGARVTLTLAIRQNTEATFRSNTIPPTDYAGGVDHTLLELSDCLPAKAYAKDKL